MEMIIETKPYLNISGSYKRTIVCGDIHGCYDEMIELLDRVKFGSDDLFVTVGDFMDRGPESWKVIRFIYDTPNVFSVLGNHERRIIGTVRGTSQPAWSQKHSLSMIADEELPEWIAFMESFPAVIETPHALITHARLDPGKDVYSQDPYFTCAVGGENSVIEIDDNGVPIWFHDWERRHGVNRPICMGHIRYSRNDLVKGRLYALDDDVVKGGSLTAVVFPGHEIVSVRAKRNYYTESLQQWKEKNNIPPEPGDMKFEEIIRLRKRSDCNKARDRLLESFFHMLEDSGVDGAILRLTGKMRDRFDVVPELGKERGEFIMRIKRLFTDPMDGRIAIFLLTKRAVEVDKILGNFYSLTLNEFVAHLNKFEESLDKLSIG